MYNLTDIREIHLELTTKCQARCPMCPRRINGGMINPLFSLTEITLDMFKSWFHPSFLKQLDSIFFCGNLGDPIIAQDCLEIIEYIRLINPNMQLSMHTNASARNTEWWSRLALNKVRVVFGIDGLEDTHHLYRVGTDWKKIIENAKSFINSGGEAEWHMLAFEHNEHQINECQRLSEELKFQKFILKHTSRFTDDKFHVLDEAGRTTHVIKPTEKSRQMIFKVKEVVDSGFETKTISCKAKKSRQIYVSAEGIVSPCCWLDFSWILHKQDTRIDYMDKVDLFPNLNEKSIEEIFNSGYFDIIEQTWSTHPLKECSKQCGQFDKLGAQFVNRS